MCGRKDGSIVVINAVRAALNQLLEGNQTAKAGWKLDVFFYLFLLFLVRMLHFYGVLSENHS